MTAVWDTASKLPTTISTFVELLRYRAEQQPDRIVYKFLQDGETVSDRLTYEELDRKARAIASWLQSRGLKGERALLLYPPGLEFVAAFFGCLYAGVVAVPAYPPRRNQKLSRLEAIATDAEAKIVLTATSELEKIEKRLAENSVLAALSCANTEDIDREFARDWKEEAIKEDSIAFLQYTSGSTATPKGVMVTHRNLCHNSELIRKCFEHTPDNQSVIWLPPYHDMGLIGGILQHVYSNFPVILISPFTFLQKPIVWLQAISRYRGTTSGGPNFAYDLCARKVQPDQLADLDLSSWEVAFVGAEPVRAETLDLFASTFADCGFRREAFYPCYGMAETTLIATGGWKSAAPIVTTVETAALQENRVVLAKDDTKPGVQKVVGCGRTSSDSKIIIVDVAGPGKGSAPGERRGEGQGERRGEGPFAPTEGPPNRIGEIWIRSESVAAGYWHRQQQTEETFRASLAGRSEEQFLRTGDLGFLLDGELFVTGRLKDVVIVRGRNFYPQDIELTLEASHYCLRANSSAAFSVEVETEERLVVVAEVERQYTKRQEELEDAIAKIREAIWSEYELAVYGVVLLRVATIPKTSSGKIQRHACKKGFLEGTQEAIASWRQTVPLPGLVSWRTVADAERQKLVDVSATEAPRPELEEKGTAETIEAWLISHLAKYVGMEAEEIDIEESFANYGLDSSVALTITEELAQWLGRDLEPTLFWEYPSIEAVSQYLEAEN